MGLFSGREMRRVRRDMYKVQRTLGDFDAAERGPGVLGKRLARRYLTRQVMRRIWGR